jgi:ubiquinol-cytochrome c reductase cytochrome b subunit
LPFIILGLVVVHFSLLHVTGNNNPLGIDHDFLIPFYPYFILKDLLALSLMLVVLCYLVFFNPNILGHPANYIPADPFVTPKHIVPE